MKQSVAAEVEGVDLDLCVLASRKTLTDLVNRSIINARAIAIRWRCGRGPRHQGPEGPQLAWLRGIYPDDDAGLVRRQDFEHSAGSRQIWRDMEANQNPDGEFDTTGGIRSGVNRSQS